MYSLYILSDEHRKEKRMLLFCIFTGIKVLGAISKRRSSWQYTSFSQSFRVLLGRRLSLQYMLSPEPENMLLSCLQYVYLRHSSFHTWYDYFFRTHAVFWRHFYRSHWCNYYIIDCTMDYRLMHGCTNHWFWDLCKSKLLSGNTYFLPWNPTQIII